MKYNKTLLILAIFSLIINSITIAEQWTLDLHTPSDLVEDSRTVTWHEGEVLPWEDIDSAHYCVEEGQWKLKFRREEEEEYNITEDTHSVIWDEDQDACNCLEAEGFFSTGWIGGDKIDTVGIGEKGGACCGDDAFEELGIYDSGFLTTKGGGLLEGYAKFVCAKDTDSKMDWVPVHTAGREGDVFHIDYGNYEVLSDKSKWYACDALGDGTANFDSDVGEVVEKQDITYVGHDYICYVNKQGKEQFAECIGDGPGSNNANAGTYGVRKLTGQSIQSTPLSEVDYAFEWEVESVGEITPLSTGTTVGSIWEYPFVKAKNNYITTGACFNCYAVEDMTYIVLETRELKNCYLGDDEKIFVSHGGGGCEVAKRADTGYVVTGIGASCSKRSCHVDKLYIETKELKPPCELGPVKTVSSGGGWGGPEKFRNAPEGHIITAVGAGIDSDKHHFRVVTSLYTHEINSPYASYFPTEYYGTGTINTLHSGAIDLGKFAGDDELPYTSDITYKLKSNNPNVIVSFHPSRTEHTTSDPDAHIYARVAQSLEETPTSTYYCSEEYYWITDLDSSKSSKTTCESAVDSDGNSFGYSWTGSKCCGDDPADTYNDLASEATAGCFNNLKVESNSLIADTNLVTNGDFSQETDFWDKSNIFITTNNNELVLRELENVSQDVSRFIMPGKQYTLSADIRSTGPITEIYAASDGEKIQDSSINMSELYDQKTLTKTFTATGRPWISHRRPNSIWSFSFFLSRE